MSKLDRIYQEMPPGAVARLLVGLAARLDRTETEQVMDCLPKYRWRGIDPTITQSVTHIEHCLLRVGMGYWMAFSQCLIASQRVRRCRESDDWGGLMDAEDEFLRCKARLDGMEHAFGAMCEDAGLDREEMRTYIGCPLYREPGELTGEGQGIYEGWMEIWGMCTGD